MTLPAKFNKPTAHPILRKFAAELVELLYADCDSGELTGENTLAEKSCADFVEAVSLLVDRFGMTPRTVIEADREKQ